MSCPYEFANVIFLVRMDGRLVVFEVSPLSERFAAVGEFALIRPIIGVESLVNLQSPIC